MDQRTLARAGDAGHDDEHAERDIHRDVLQVVRGGAGGDTPTGSIEYKTIFAVGMLLFVITLLMNLVAIRFVRKYRQVYE